MNLNQWNQQIQSGIAEAQATPSSQTTISPASAFVGDQGASELLGKLSRAQWEDWKARFSPYISSLAGLASDPNADLDAANMAKSSVTTAFDNAQEGLQMQREGLGINLTPAQRQAERRSTAMERTGAKVSAGNQARVAAQDRQMQILAGGMGLQNIPDEVLNR